MTIKDKIEKLREELEFSISVASDDELTKDEIVKISQKLDEAIVLYYQEGNKEIEE
ncbi:MAG: aspartyl-phosphate phosphatase Spo0E family protein [Alkaliphilus sp.]|nr:aspartyl-phosphate phosphatase Spo0E family protein [Alkaliphilus sp.]